MYDVVFFCSKSQQKCDSTRKKNSLGKNDIVGMGWGVGGLRGGGVHN